LLSPEKPLRRNQPTALTIEVPGYGDFYNPEIKASNATVNPSAIDKKVVTITPTGDQTTVSISTLTNGQRIKIGDVTYLVK
jgi:hypothetical protein